MPQPMLCNQCGSVTTPRRVVPGSSLITLLLLLFFILPGIIYMLWRHSSAYWACRQCGSRNIMPTTSPVAQEMIASKPGVSQSMAQEQLRRQDIRTGFMVFVGIAAVIFVIAKLGGC